VAAIMQATTRASDLRLWHSEDIGPHYVTTLKLWREKFFANIAAVRSLGFDDRFIRLWEYYLAYCEGAFRARHVGDVQMLFTKPRSTLAPVDSETAAMKSRPPGIAWSSTTRSASNSPGASHASRTDSASDTPSTPSSCSRQAARPRPAPG
jgi:hypothetical protein